MRLVCTLSVSIVCAAAATAIVAPAQAAAPARAAAPATIKVGGRLPGHAGIVVLAVGRTGTTKAARLDATGSFSFTLVKAAAKDTSLHLIGPDGRYAGPVVLATAPQKAYTALGGATVDVGMLTLKNGYARVSKKLTGAVLDPARWSRADKDGKPAGAGRLGMVRMTIAKKMRTSAMAGGPAAGQPGDDTDGDGIVNLFDADDNGNGTLDIVDPASAQSNAGLYSILAAPFGEAVNANVGEVGTAQLDALLTGGHRFVLGYFYDDHYVGGRAIAGVNVDCFTLAYCRRDTGTAQMVGAKDAEPGTPWASYSPDGSGLPNLQSTGPDRWQMGIEPNVTSAQINAGDAMAINFRLASGETVSVPTALAAYFVTTPALSHWDNGTDSGDVRYSGDDVSTGQFTAPDGHITLTAFRPQRKGFPGEPAYLDMGRLHWGVTIAVEGEPEHGCGGYFSNLSPTLHDDYSPASHKEADALFPLHDSADDAAPGSGQTVRFTLDVAGCAQHFGLEGAGRTVRLAIAAATEPRPGGMDRATQEFTVQLP
jgi:hypothetical protein